MRLQAAETTPMTTQTRTSGTFDPILAGFSSVALPPQVQARTESSQERMLRAIEAHAAAEADSLAEYKNLAATSGDPVVALLMHFIVEDEQRHHRLLEQMAVTLRDGLSWTHSPDALPAAAATEPSPDLGQAIETTRSLIREEREGARHVRHLSRQEPRLYGGLYALILEMIGKDSTKHEHLLRFVQRRLEGRGNA